MKATFTLTRPAKKSGGDRYESGDWTIYFPQAVSRPKGTPVHQIEITITPVEAKDA